MSKKPTPAEKAAATRKRNAKARRATKGKRYTTEEIAEFLNYADRVDREKGRGGITAAAKKFGITPLTISNHRKKRDRLTGGSPRSRNGGTPAALREQAAQAEKLRELADLVEQAAKLRVELNLDPITL